MSKIEVQFKTEKGKELIFVPLKDRWLEAKPEEKVRQRFICDLVNDYGYSLEQMDQEFSVTTSNRGTGRARADIVIWKSVNDKQESNNASIVVECKSDDVTIQTADYYQGQNYASWVGADFFITHNSKETRCFEINKGKIPKHLGRELPMILRATDLLLSIEEIKEKEKVFKKDEFTNLLKQCHNIIRNNDKLSPEAAFDEISKVLFTKIIYERYSNKNNIFSKQAFIDEEKQYDLNVRPYLQSDADKNADYVQIIFRKTKEKYSKDSLFANNDEIRIRRESFLSIVEKLQVYNLSKTSDDVKGIAFEEFLGTTFRGELGQFFTPRKVVDFMVDILTPSFGELICDPCAGSGGFLIKAFEYIRESIEQDIEDKKTEIKEKYFDETFEKKSEKEKKIIESEVEEQFKELNKDLVDIDNEDTKIFHLSKKAIFGTDANPRMARVSKMNMIMHGDGHNGIHHSDGLINVNGIFRNHFDVILTNPPFGSTLQKGYSL